jgi:hypothetical protein
MSGFHRSIRVCTVLEEIDGLIAQGVTYVYFVDEIFLPQKPLLEALAGSCRGRRGRPRSGSRSRPRSTRSRRRRAGRACPASTGPDRGGGRRPRSGRLLARPPARGRRLGQRPGAALSPLGEVVGRGAAPLVEGGAAGLGQALDPGLDRHAAPRASPTSTSSTRSSCRRSRCWRPSPGATCASGCTRSRSRRRYWSRKSILAQKLHV